MCDETAAPDIITRPTCRPTNFSDVLYAICLSRQKRLQAEWAQEWIIVRIICFQSNNIIVSICRFNYFDYFVISKTHEILTDHECSWPHFTGEYSTPHILPSLSAILIGYVIYLFVQKMRICMVNLQCSCQKWTHTFKIRASFSDIPSTNTCLIYGFYCSSIWFNKFIRSVVSVFRFE